MPARYQLIAAWANRHGWKYGAELGVFSGRTHFTLLDACPSIKLLIGVDVWDTVGFKEGPTKSGEKCYCPYCEETRADRRLRDAAGMRHYVTMKSAEYTDRSLIYIEPTTQVARLVRDGSLDFIFVDADHSTEGVAADISAWRSKLRPGGWLIGHDWNMASVRDGVAKALGSIVGIKTADDHVWLMKC